MTTKPIVKVNLPVGHRVRSLGATWWEGGCTCGSGLEGHEVFDHNGIYFGIGCAKCKKKAAYYEPWEENTDDEPW